MKHLPKHLQPRWRYLAVEFHAWPDAEFERQCFQRALWERAGDLVGDAGVAGLALQVVVFRYEEGRGAAVVRTRRRTVSTARAVVATLDRVDGSPLGVRVSGVGGTVRSCKEKYIGDARIRSKESTVVFNNAERTAIFQSARVDIRTENGWIAATERDLE